MPLMKRGIFFLFPYAGITRIRYSGLFSVSFPKHPEEKKEVQ
jgi:hypothetical protein